MIMNIIIILLQIGILIELKSIKNKINDIIQEIVDIRLNLVKLKEKTEDIEELIMTY